MCVLSFRMNEMGLSPTENKVYFGQLLGMCDQISFPLGMSPLGTDTKSKLRVTASRRIASRGGASREMRPACASGGH